MVDSNLNTKKLCVGLTYNLKRIKPKHGGVHDEEAEYDSKSTIEAIRQAILSHGHDVVLLEATADIIQRLPRSNIDIVFNVAEGLRGRNRESQIPALLELLDIPYTGSDPATLALALDKGLAKRIVKHAGILTPGFATLVHGDEPLPPDLTFPAIVKPVAEGSSKGVLGVNVIENEAAMRVLAREMINRYHQGVLVESFLPGREFTIAVLCNNQRTLDVLPPMEVVFQSKIRFPVYGFDQKLETNDDVRYENPAKVSEALGQDLKSMALQVFNALGCRDVARIDIRLDAQGRANFIECNPLPGLTPDWSDLCLIAKASGISYPALIGRILEPAIERWTVKQKTGKGFAKQ